MVFKNGGVLVKRNGIIVVVLAILFISGCGKVRWVSQNITEVELGDDIILEDTVSCDESVSSIEVADDGGFSSEKAGEYKVRFLVTNSKGKQEEVVFCYVVKDTVAPVIECENRIYIQVGDEFDIDKYISCADASGTQVVECIGNVDSTKEGETSISVVAKDASGNESEIKNVTIVIEEKPDIRNVKWGYSTEQVKSHEKEGNLVDQGETTDDVGTYLAYENIYVGSIKMTAEYFFNEKDQLVALRLFLADHGANFDAYVNDYEKLKELLIEKYGEPDEQHVNYSESAKKYLDTPGDALIAGELEYYTAWYNNDKMEILSGLLYYDGVVGGVDYYSKEFDLESSSTSGI